MAEAEGSTKWCPKCQSSLSRDAFAKNNRRPDGLKGWCRACHNQAGKKAYAAASPEEKARRLAIRAKWKSENEDKFRGYARAYQKRNPDKFAAINKRCRLNNVELARTWARNNHARRKGATGKYTVSDIADILKLQRGKCAYCRKSVKRESHADHIMPIRLGGTNDRRNIQLTCPSCNHKKHAKHPLVFARETGRLL